LSAKQLHARAEAGGRGVLRHALSWQRWEFLHDRIRIVDSPIGRLLLQTDGVSLTGLYMDVAAVHPGNERRQEDANAGPLRRRRGSSRILRGTRRDFDLPLHLQGTQFQQRVWRALTEIPYGATWSYGELAKRIGNPNASRAVGLANAAIPFPSWFRAIGSSVRTAR